MNPPEPQPTPDSKSWSEFAQRLLSLAERTVEKRGIRGFDAEDLATEALAEAWRYFSEKGKPVPREEDLAPLVTRIAQRRAIDLRRRQHRESGLPAPEEKVSPEPRPDPRLVDSLEVALGNLSAFERQVIELHVLHGLTYAEVSNFTGAGVESVRAAAARATRMLRSSISK